MSWGVANGLMLMGLAGVAIPVVVHLLNRRWEPVVDWGAMQFLELSRRSRRRFQITEWLLMLARMALLALVALALARPFWKPTAAVAGSGAAGNGGGGAAARRDVVIVLDNSASMGRKAKGTTPRAEALAWTRRCLAKLGPADSTAIILAGDRVRPVVDPPSFDRAKLEAALAKLPPPRGSSDLPAALAEAFRIVERTQNPERDIIVLTDGQRLAWRPGEASRWALLRELRKRLPVPPRLWSVALLAGTPSDGPNGSVGPLELSRGLVAPGLPVTVRTQVANAGPGTLTETVELLVDGRPVPRSAQVIGPIPAGGRTPISFSTPIATPGSHLLTVRLASGDDSLPGDDEASRPVEVAEALPVLLVNGEPSPEPFRGETDFLRAALAPAGDETPLVRAKVIRPDALSTRALEGRRVLVLANVDRLDAEQAAAVESFLARGGGILVAPGSQTDRDFANDRLFRGGEGWLPASLGPWKGDLTSRRVVAHPAPASFAGQALAPFGQGTDPPLGSAGLFAYLVLGPATKPPAAAVVARLDTGDPWVVERPSGRGRVAMLAGPIDADGGTLPVNPDFVPWAHELIFHLADAQSQGRVIRPGESIALELDLDPSPKLDAKTVGVLKPDGTEAKAALTRVEGSRATRLRFDDTAEAGVYRVTLPGPGDEHAYVLVEADARESDAAPLEPAEADRLAQGWPLAFESEPDRLVSRLFSAGGGGRHEVWRGLVLAALGGLCLEVWLTRQLVRGRGDQQP